MREKKSDVYAKHSARALVCKSLADSHLFHTASAKQKNKTVERDMGLDVGMSKCKAAESVMSPFA